MVACAQHFFCKLDSRASVGQLENEENTETTCGEPGKRTCLSLQENSAAEVGTVSALQPSHSGHEHKDVPLSSFIRYLPTIRADEAEVLQTTGSFMRNPG